MRPYNLLFLQFLPESPDLLPPGERRLRLQLDTANNMLIPEPSRGVWVIEDNEYQRLLVSWRRGVARGTEVGISAPILWRDGGYLDPLLSLWHRLLGIPAQGQDVLWGRDAYPPFRSILYLTDARGRSLLQAGSAFGPGDLSLTLKRALGRPTPRAALAARLGLKLPTGNPGLLLGSGAPDAGVSLDARYNAGRDLLFYGGLAGVVMGRPTRVPNARRAMLQWFFGVEYRPNRRDSYLWQSDGSTLAVRTGHPFVDSAAATVSFGYRRVLDRRLTLTASISENGDYHNFRIPALGSIGPDFTTSLALEWR